MNDTIKVVVDYQKALKEEKTKIDTGSWRLLLKNKKIEKYKMSIGLDLKLDGTKYDFN
jgi:hypothetical protein